MNNNEMPYYFSYTPPVIPSRDLSLDRKRLCMPAVAIAFIFLFTVVLQLLLAIPVRLYAPELAAEGWFAVAFSSVPMYAIAMPLSLVFFRMAPAAPSLSEKKKLSVPVLLGLIGICFLITYAGNFVSNIVNTVLEVITGVEQTNPVADMTMNTPLWANLLFVGILAPIMEEIFLRKLVIDRIQTFGELPAVLISGVAFGLVHGNFSQFFYAAGVGILFGYVYLRTGKLRYTVAMHMVMNIIGGVYTTETMKLIGDMTALESALAGGTFDPSLLTGGQWIGLAMLALYSMFMMAAIAGGIVAICLLKRRVYFVKGNPPPTRREWVHIALANPGTWIFLIVSGAMFFMN